MSTSPILPPSMIVCGGGFPEAASSSSLAPAVAATNQDSRYKAVAKQLSADLEDTEIRAQDTVDLLSTRAQDLAVKVFMQGKEIRIKDRTLNAQSDRIKTLEKSLTETLQEKATLEKQLRAQKIQNGELIFINDDLTHRLGENEARRESLQKQLDLVLANNRELTELKPLVSNRDSLSSDLKVNDYILKGTALMTIPIGGYFLLPLGFITAGVAGIGTAAAYLQLADRLDRIFDPKLTQKRATVKELNEQITTIQKRIAARDPVLQSSAQV